MTDHPFERQEQLTLQVESSNWTVVPGSSVNIALTVHNHSPADGFFELSASGIPSNWVSVPSPTIRLAAGERREVYMTIQPPTPMSHAGRQLVRIRVANQALPEQAAEVNGTLTVTGHEVPGRIGLLLATTDFRVAPGQTLPVPIVLLNQGLEGDIVNLSVEGIPSSWVYTAAPASRLAPGQQQEVTLNIQPPHSQEAGAGRRPFRIVAHSQSAPGQVTAADCVLSITSFSEFDATLSPSRVQAGEPGRVAVENQGNIQQTFTVSWQSPDEALAFEPGPSQELRASPGQLATAEFRASPQRRPFIGGEFAIPFVARVQAAGGEARNLSGEVLGRALIPGWILGAILVLIVAIACISLSVALLGSLGSDAAPTEPPVVQPTDDGQQPLPTQPAPEQPTAEPETTVEPPTQPPPPAEQSTEPPPEPEVTTESSG